MKHCNERSSSGRFARLALSLSVAASAACARGAAGSGDTAATRGRVFASGGAQAIAVVVAHAPARPAPLRAAQVSARQPAPVREEGPRLEGAARREQVQSLAQRSGVANACWNDAVAHLPQHRPERVGARIAVNEQGRARVTVSDAEDPRLANCMRLRFASQSYGPGGAVEIDTSWQFSLNE